MTKKGGRNSKPAPRKAAQPKTRTPQRPAKAPEAVDAKVVTEQYRPSSILDSFSNPLARIGVGTSSLLEGTTYPIQRISNAYPLLISLYRNSWITRAVIDGYANDMTKAGFKLNTEVPPGELKRFQAELNKTATMAKLLEALKWSRLFGGSVAVMAIKGQEDELDQPLDVDSVEPNSYKGLLVFDRWSGVSPDSNICVDIDDPANFGLPLHYLIQPEQGRPYRVHHSRLLRLVGGDLPRWEFQANQWWGISEIEVMFEELRKRDNTSWAIANMLFRSNLLVIKDDQIAALVSGLGISGEAAQRAYAAYQAMNEMISNQSILALTTKGGLETHQYSFGGLSEIQVNAMLDICGATGYTMAKLFGRSSTGLAQTGEGDEALYSDRVKQKQERELSPQLWKLLPVMAMSIWGKVPDDLTHTWLPIQSPSNKERSELGRSNADSVMVVFNGGVIGRKTALMELKQQSDETGIFSNITDDDIAKADNEIAPDKSGEMPGGAGGAGGLEALMGGAPGKPGESPEGAEGGEAGGEPDEEAQTETLKKMIEATAPDKRQKLIEGMLATIEGRGAEGGQGAGGEAGATGPKGTAKVRQPTPMSGGNARDAKPTLKEGEPARVDPQKLTFRQYHLGRMAQVSQYFRDGVSLPLVVLDRPQGWEILDGHHRCAFAIQSGWRSVPIVPLKGAHYDVLHDAGFSDPEVVWATLRIADKPSAAELEADEHSAEPVAKRGKLALAALMAMQTPEAKSSEDELVGEIPPIPETTGYAEGEANVGVEAG